MDFRASRGNSRSVTRLERNDVESPGLSAIALPPKPVDPGRWSPPQQNSKELDVVQFLSRVFFVNEWDLSCTITVIRIGGLKGTCSIGWQTQDSSAVSGLKYMGGSGVITFGPGEAVRTFAIEIIDDDSFDTALDFDILLGDPQNCVTDPRLRRSRVLILDDDQFPSNDFEDVVEEHSEAAYHEGGKLTVQLLWAFVCFCFSHVPTVKWKSILVLLLSNLGNLYYLATIFMRVYLTDTILNTKDPGAEDRLIIPGSRNGTAIALAFAFVLPNVILLASDYFEMAVLEMGFYIRYHLRVNLFRKYLRYTEESRAQVPIQVLKISIMEDIPELVAQGYLILFDLWAMFGKIAMVAIFILQELPRSALPLMVYPSLIFIYLIWTHRRRMELMAKEGDGKSATVECLMRVHKGTKLMDCYEKRTEVVREFEEVLRSQRKHVMELKSFDFWNSQLIPWITHVAIGTYIAGSAHLVSTKKISLGALVQTISVYKDLGDRFGTILVGLEDVSRAISPLAGIAFQFNLETDVPHRASLFELKEDYALKWSASGRSFDDIPFSFQRVPIERPSGTVDFSAMLQQGSVLQITGPHDAGKGRLLKKFCDIDHSATGAILMSPHLFVLHVPHEPLFDEPGSLFQNLHFLASAEEIVDPHMVWRGRRIIKRLLLDKEWILKEYDSNSGVEANWFLNLSGSEKWRFQLARAFISNPHVLVVHRPVDELDPDLKEVVLPLLREFVDKRGLEMNEDGSSLTMRQRRPRTVIYSTGTDTETTIPDYVWHVGDTGVPLVQQNRRPARA